MQQLEIKIPSLDIVEFFGANNQKFAEIKKHFPKLKIIARGDTIKVQGDPEVVSVFEDKINTMFWFFEKFNKITKKDIERILETDSEEIKNNTKGQNDVLVYGPNGNTIRARSKKPTKNG